MRNLTTLLAALALLATAATGGASAQDFKKGAIMIDHPWARATIPNRPGAAYVKLSNMGGEADRLVAAATAAAGRAELHTHIMDGDVMKMRRIEAIEVPAGGGVALEPGGHHIMLFDLAAPLKEGASFPMTLTFEKAGAVEVTVTVQAMGSSGGMSGMKEGEHGVKHGGSTE